MVCRGIDLLGLGTKWKMPYFSLEDLQLIVFGV